jgi:hypothetical protein
MHIYLQHGYYLFHFENGFVVNDKHPFKRLGSRNVIEFNIMIDNNDNHPLKQLKPRENTEFEILSKVNDDPPSK